MPHDLRAVNDGLTALDEQLALADEFLESRARAAALAIRARLEEQKGEPFDEVTWREIAEEIAPVLAAAVLADGLEMLHTSAPQAAAVLESGIAALKRSPRHPLQRKMATTTCRLLGRTVTRSLLRPCRSSWVRPRCQARQRRRRPPITRHGARRGPPCSTDDPDLDPPRAGGTA